jgi:hypothetical protein
MSLITTQASYKVVYLDGQRKYQPVLRQRGQVVQEIGQPVFGWSTAKATATNYLHKYGQPTLNGWVMEEL